MSAETARLDQVAELTDSLHKSPTYSKTGYKMVRVTDVKGRFLNLESALCVDEDVFIEFSKRKRPAKGDIVFSRVGSYGRSSYVNDSTPFCLGQNTLLISPKIDSRYLHLTLESPDIKWQIEQAVTGSTQKTISIKSISALNIPLYSAPTMEAIAHILGTLDDKIELNRQTNKTLESIARAIFKSWFVDFDPVRAKRDGKTADLSLSSEILDLFPDSFQDSKLGEIPSGWDLQPLGDIITVKRGGSPRPIKDYIVEDGIPWVKIRDATATKSRFLFSTKECIKPEGLNKTVLLQAGELILSNSATPGLPMFLQLNACIHDGWLYFPKISKLNKLYLYQLFLEIRKELVMQGNGSVFTNLKTDILKEQLIVVPDPSVMKVTTEILSAFHEKALLKASESRTLSELRDTLLPKLISGELRIKDAEKFLKDAPL